MALQVIRVSVVCGDAVVRNRIRDALAAGRGFRLLEPKAGSSSPDRGSPEYPAVKNGTLTDGPAEPADLLVLHTGSGGIPAWVRTPFLLVSSSPPRNPIPTVPGGRFRGWLPERFTGEELRAAARAAALGLIVFHPAADSSAPAPGYGAQDDRAPGGTRPKIAARGLRDRTEGQAVSFDGREPPHPDLTEREREVLVLLASGYANAEIGRILSVSENTVKFHLQSIYRKLEVSGRAEAVLAGIRSGEIPL